MKKRRAVSQMIGSLLLLAIVTSVGSVILFNGLDEINAFKQNLSNYDQTQNEALQEDIIFEHIRFTPSTDTVTIFLRNIGTVETTISSISMVKLGTQDILVEWEDFDLVIPIKGGSSASLQANLLQGSGTWDDPYYVDKEYKISITTTRGIFFDTIGKPFNT